MREVDVSLITAKIRELFLEANYFISPDIEQAVADGQRTEQSPVGRQVLCQLSENYRIARDEHVAICQDTGMAVVFMELGQEVHLTGGLMEDAVNEGVRQAYRDGYLRKSVVADPVFDRKNTGDNTPAVLHLKLTAGDRIRILVTAKGFGSENMSAVKMLTPAQGAQGAEDFIVDTVRRAGPNPCPPVIVGVGIGGTLETAALTAKRMTCRAVGSHNADARYADMEERVLERVNRLGIGPAGIGGTVTALAVNIDQLPTHIAGLPIAVNMCCHAARHAQGEI